MRTPMRVFIERCEFIRKEYPMIHAMVRAEYSALRRIGKYNARVCLKYHFMS